MNHWSARILTFLFLCLTGNVGVGTAADSPTVQKPNVILILADDLGWKDLACQGSPLYETPHLDKLAQEGMRFTQAYSACTVCSPTRAALLTGKYPARLHITDWIAGHEQPKAKLLPPHWTKQLPLEEVTLAERFHSAGAVCGLIGKWHLGGTGFEPEKQGFDLNLGGTEKGQPPSYFSPYNIPTLPDGPAGESLTEREADEAIKFIETNKERPFFLYLPRFAVHTPLQAKPELIAKYKQKIEAARQARDKTNDEAAQATAHGQHALPQHAVYAAMVETLDTSLGRLLDKLDQLKLSDRTIVIFTSDNGGLTLGNPPTTSNAPLRAGKGSAYEGGVRVPFIARWPGVIPANTTCDTPVMTIDVTPTLLELSGLKPATGEIMDGMSLAPLLKQTGPLSRDAIYWHYPHYHPGGATPYSAVRAGDWRFVQYYEEPHVELFQLKNDPGEAHNIANQEPAKVQELTKKLNDWLASVAAQPPVPNPNWDGHRAEAAIHPQTDGSILLHSRDVEIHGVNLRYEPQPHKNTVGYWSKLEDWASWDFQVTQAGTYSLEIVTGCGNGSGGADVEFECASQKLPFLVKETGGFQNWVTRDLGTLTLTAGRQTLSVKPKTKPGVAVMDLQQVLLKPVNK